MSDRRTVAIAVFLIHRVKRIASKLAPTRMCYAVNLSSRKSRSACSISSRVFITNGPYCTIGSRNGLPAMTSTLAPEALLSCTSPCSDKRARRLVLMA